MDYQVRPLAGSSARRHDSELLKGGFKKTTGRSTDNPRLKAEGRGDEAKGNLKQAGAKVKDAFEH